MKTKTVEIIATKSFYAFVFRMVRISISSCEMQIIPETNDTLHLPPIVIVRKDEKESQYHTRDACITFIFLTLYSGL